MKLVTTRSSVGFFHLLGCEAFIETCYNALKPDGFVQSSGWGAPTETFCNALERSFFLFIVVKVRVDAHTFLSTFKSDLNIE